MLSICVVEPFLLFLHLFVMIIIESTDFLCVFVIDVTDLPKGFISGLLNLPVELVIDCANTNINTDLGVREQSVNNMGVVPILDFVKKHGFLEDGTQRLVGITQVKNEIFKL